MSEESPEIMGIPNLVTNKLELHNTWLVSSIIQNLCDPADFGRLMYSRLTLNGQ